MVSQQQYTTNKVVFAIGGLNFDGNIIPHEWYQYLKTQNDVPHMTAIIILSEVLYWYRPTIIRDEYTGKVIGYRQKFKADKLQRSYQSFVEQFGFSKGQVKSAVDYLVDEGYLTREFRNITVGDGLKLSNVMYLEPVIDAIERITKPQPLDVSEELVDAPQEIDTPPITTKSNIGGVGQSTHGGYAGGVTNTETTTEISTETTTEKESGANAPAAAEPPAENPIQPSVKGRRKRPPKDVLTPEQEQERKRLIPVIREVCKYDPTLAPNSLIGKIAKSLAKANYTAAQVKGLYSDGGWWYKEDWRGQKGQVPEPHLIGKTILQAVEWARANYDAKRASTAASAPPVSRKFVNPFTGQVERGANGNGKQKAARPTAP